MTNISLKQIKAARAILGWSQETLAEESGLSIATIRKVEAGNMSPRIATNQQLREALENGGVEFISSNGVRERPEEITVYEGKTGIQEFFNKVYEEMNSNGGIISVISQSDHLFYNALDDGAGHIERMTRINNKVTVHCLITEDKDDLLCTSYCAYKWIPEEYISIAPFYIFNDYFSIITFDKNYFPKIRVIRSSSVAESFRRLFNSLWDKAIPLNTKTGD